MPAITREYKEWPLTWEKGLVTEIEDSALDFGQASALLNWEPTAQGGLRARNGWARISTDGLPAAYKVRGISTIAAEANPRVVQSWAWPNSDDPTSTTPVDNKQLTLSGVTAGNVLVAIVHADASISAAMSEAGWTEITADSDNTTRAFKKVASGSETTATVVQTGGGTIVKLRPAAITFDSWSQLPPVSNIADESDATGSGSAASADGYGQLDSGVDPGVNTNHVWTVRSSGSAGTGAGSARLYQGDPGGAGVLIKDTGNLPEGVGIVETSVTLTEGEAAAITDYTDLHWRITASGGTHNTFFADVWLSLPSSDTENIIAFEVFELGAVQSSVAASDTDVTEPTISLSATPGQPGGVAILAYSSADDGGVTPNAKATPGGWTRRNVSWRSGQHRAYAFTKVYTSTAAVADTWNHGVTVQPAGGVELLFDLELNGTVAFYIVLAIATATGYSLYRILRDDIETGTWELIDSDTASSNDAFVSMAQGAGELVWSATGMDQPRQVTLSTLAAIDVTDLTADAAAGRAVCYHKDRMFVGGSATNPARLYFSQIGDPDQFVPASDYLDVGGDDGEAIQDLVSVEGLLLVCKTNRLYLISGSGVESFFVNELPGGSAAAGRPAVRTPYGTLVAGDAEIWVVQGGAVDPMSRPLGTNYELTSASRVSTAYAQDSVLIADSSTGTVYRANLVSGAWMLEAVDDVDDAVGHLFGLQGRLYYGVINSTASVGGTRRLSSSRANDYVGGTDFLASTGKMSMLGPSYRYTPRFLFFQTRSHNPAQTNVLHVQIETDQGDDDLQSITIVDEVQRDRIDLGKYKGCEWVKVTLTANSSAIAPAIDVEKSVFGVLAEPYR